MAHRVEPVPAPLDGDGRSPTHHDRHVHELSDGVVEAVHRLGRDDLAVRAQAIESRYGDRRTRVLVAGDFKVGKSSLVNALVNADVCPVDDRLATAAMLVVTYADQPSAHWVRSDDDGRSSREPVTMDELRQRALEFDSPDGTVTSFAGGGVGEVCVHRRLLAGGLTLIDTPGVGGLEGNRGSLLASLLQSDAVLFVTHAAQELTAAEIDFLTRADAIRPVVVVMTKIDFYPAWRKIVDLDRGHLRRAGLACDVIPVSSRLRTQALAGNDRDLNGESGFDTLIRDLSRLGGKTAATAAAGAGRDAAAVLRDLVGPIESERQSLSNSGEAAELVERLREATQRYERLRTGASAWRRMLVDGMSDVNSDIEFDLKERVRLVANEAESAIDEFDPGERWEEFDQWLHQRVTHEVVANHTWAVQRAEALLSQVEATFAEEDHAVARSVDLTPVERGTQTGELAVQSDTTDDDERGVVRRSLVAARGMQGGVVLLSVLGQMMGLTVAAPIVFGIGLALGGRALREERRRQLEARRRRATAGVRKYLDEVSFNASKETRDLLRVLQRTLREALTERAEELVRTARLSVDAAQRAEAADRTSRAERIRSLDAELRRVQSLQRRAAALAKLEVR